jgi:GntR family transcriptional regulator of vanillate catabolism
MDTSDDLARKPGTSVVAALRQLILDGRFAAGERMAEIPVAQALGVSRTPVRLAFRSLEQEGLLQRVGPRSLVVRQVSDDDLLSGIEVRGVLEGLATRRLAERGLDAATLATLQACLDEGDAVLAAGRLDEEHIDRWSALNLRFHHTIVAATGSRVIAEAIGRNNHLPFASADSIVIDRQAIEREYEKLRLAQVQHRLIVDALQRRESARAEMLMREHAYIGFRYAIVCGPTATPNSTLSNATMPDASSPTSPANSTTKKETT